MVAGERVESVWASLTEMAGMQVVGSDQPLGCHLAFGDRHTPIGDFGFEGPIKPLIDALWPLLGGVSGRPADHRIRDLRVVSGAGMVGVEVTLWLHDLAGGSGS